MSTIVALASPSGLGALHIIRVSGPDTFFILNKISTDEVKKTQDRLQVTFLRSRNNSLIDQVVLMKFYAPNSYTGEDCIEITCHGNGLISKLIIDEILKYGARYAENGEFTKRAYLNSKIDLNHVFNISNIYSSTSELDIYSSVNELKAGSSTIIKRNLDSLFNILAECELNIDYPPDIEEDLEYFISEIKKKTNLIYSELKAIFNNSKAQILSKYRVVIVGKPNAGKSSLVNYLVGSDRVIVSGKEGTTTDSIEIDYCFENYLLTLVDTAGIDSLMDSDESLYYKKTQKEIESADLLIYLKSCEFTEDDAFWNEQIKNKQCIELITKSDLLNSKEKYSNLISVKNNDIDYLKNKLNEHLKKHYVVIGLKSKDGINMLGKALEELDLIIKNNLSVDLIVEHLNYAYDHLSSILHLNPTKWDKINSIFDGFCVGK